MSRYEYNVIPAPKKGRKIKGARGSEARFAAALSAVMNEQAALGWEYLRTDTLPMSERKGLTGSTTSFQNMLVFRRLVGDAEASLTPPALTGASIVTPAIAAPEEPSSPKLIAEATEGAAPALGPAHEDGQAEDSAIDAEDEAEEPQREEAS